MRDARGHQGFTLLEMAVTAGVIALLMTLAVTRWTGYLAIQRVRQGTIQVATDLRQAIERAKSERAEYTVTFVASSSSYVIARVAGGFTENTRLPDGVTVTASQVVRVSPYGQPVDGAGVRQAYTVTVQNSAGTGNVSVNATGGVSYTVP
ncbi:MAG: type II secretion system protein [Armatimonadota bacterium]|nr:type II secretion system protein [Armatimonadota bacterium]